jgi:hypothetical protein
MRVHVREAGHDVLAARVDNAHAVRIYGSRWTQRANKPVVNDERVIEELALGV